MRVVRVNQPRNSTNPASRTLKSSVKLIWAVNREQKEIPKLDTKDDVIKVYPKLFSGLGKLKGKYTILFSTGENPLHTLGCVRMELSRGDTTIQEDVYIV